MTTKLWVQHAKCMSFVNLGWTCDLWFFVAKFECKVSFMFLSSLRNLILFYLPCVKCSFSAMHHVCNVFCEVKVWAWFEVWTTNTLHQHLRPLQPYFQISVVYIQHNIVHLFLVLAFGPLSFKVFMNNLYSSAINTTNGCLEARSS
jgi:hypothetical protein